MGDPETLVLGRAAYDRRQWGQAYEQLRAGARDDGLDVDDLERLAVAAYMTGRTEAAAEALERLHLALLGAGEVSRAVRWAVWLAILLFQVGQHAQAGGWLSRAGRLMADRSEDGPERGYLLVPAALQALGGGDLEHSRELPLPAGRAAPAARAAPGGGAVLPGGQPVGPPTGAGPVPAAAGPGAGRGRGGGDPAGVPGR